MAYPGDLTPLFLDRMNSRYKVKEKPKCLSPRRLFDQSLRSLIAVIGGQPPRAAVDGEVPTPGNHLSLVAGRDTSIISLFRFLQSKIIGNDDEMTE